MYTQCVRCLTVYRLQAESLARARGQFRCGHCGTVFDGLERLTEHLPEAPFQELMHEEDRAARQFPSVSRGDAVAAQERIELRERVGLEPFVGIEQQHPVGARLRDRGILLAGEAEPVLMQDLGTRRARDCSRVIARSGIEHDHARAHLQQRRDAATDAIGFIEGDDDPGDGQAHG